jgi:pentafunctional AROM polypeptide
MNNQHSSDLLSIDTYNIRIGYGFLHELSDYVVTLSPVHEKYLLITDENLFKIYGDTIVNSFKKNNIELLCYAVPPGERSKSREEKSNIEDFMLVNKCHIDTVIVAFGGGVVGDLAGFIASTYMRGIDYIQIPTSFLSMIDSSIGAKTSINVDKYGKNLLGSFYRPKAVLIDIQLLETLSARDLRNGMAEAIKIALIIDEHLFTFIETNINQILQKNTEIMKKLIYECIKLKANIVIQDEKETTGLRSILNFGHSIGHSIEILSDGKLLHGECVSIGMLLEAELSRDKGFLINSNAVISRLNNILKSFRLPTAVPSHMFFEDIVEKMSVDKKNRNGKKQLVILTNIGSVRASPRYTTAIDDQDLINLLDTNVALVADTMNMNGTTVDVPGSKSISNRVLLLCALGTGECRIHGLLYSVDTQTMLICLRQLGIHYHWDDNEIVVMHGVNGKLNPTDTSTLYLNNSGTCSRFLTTLCTILPAKTEIILTGDERLKERPIKDLVDALVRNENSIDYLNEHGCLPIKIISNGGIKGGEIRMNGDVSSQYITSLLLISPFALTPIVLKLNQTKQIVSKPYIDMTINLMKTQFGIPIDDSEMFSYTIPNSGPYQNPPKIQIEGDASSASYFLGIAAVHPGLTVTVANIGSNSLQGDSRFCRILEMMGCRVTQTETTTTLTGPKQLQAITQEIDMNSMTDTFMTLACVAVFAHGLTQIRNISNQRLKECNRIEAIVAELRKCGIKASETDTGLDIEGNNNEDIEKSAAIHTYDDHRIAMSFSIVASRARRLRINDKRCVDKTYPEFWLHLNKVFGLKVISPSLISHETVENIKSK